MRSSEGYAVEFSAREQARLVQSKYPETDLGENEIECRTIVSLISAGTEIVGMYMGQHHSVSYPGYPGYAAVCEVLETGDSVTDIQKGDLIFTEGKHRSWQRVSCERAVKIPDGLTPEKAVLARMVKIPMPAFVHTCTKPPELAAVTGLGMVGLMAAQLARIYGYNVIACEPDPKRRDIAQEHGIDTVMDAVPVDDNQFNKQVGLGIECSGHEQAALDLCNIARIRGDVFLVGVPWVARTDMIAQKILYSVFYNYISLHSGWEGCMPKNPEIHSQSFHFKAALEWIAQEKIKIKESLYTLVSPEDPQKQYQDILNKTIDTLTVMFNWRTL